MRGNWEKKHQHLLPLSTAATDLKHNMSTDVFVSYLDPAPMNADEHMSVTSVGTFHMH